MSRADSFPPFETAGMKKKIKKKNESGSFWKFFFKGGSDLNLFLQIGSEKKKNSFLVGEEIDNCGGESLYVRYLSENSSI